MKKYCLIFICLSTVFFSCTENKQKAIENKPVKKAIGKLITDSIAPPIVTPLPKAVPMTAVITTSKPFALDPQMGKEAVTTITTSDNGLPKGDYRNIVQDNTGNLWLNTKEKIIKYDGHNFISYPLVPGENVSCAKIGIDKNNELWALISQSDSTGKGRIVNLYIFNGISFEQIPIKQSNRNARKNILDLQLFPQPDGTMWVADNIQKQLLKFARSKFKTQPKSGSL